MMETGVQAAPAKRILVACIGNIFLGDDGFGRAKAGRKEMLAELAEWVGAESKCCPFFDFHIDVEREGKLLCLRLTGEEGIKAFIRAEFGVKINTAQMMLSPTLAEQAALVRGAAAGPSASD